MSERCTPSVKRPTLRQEHQLQRGLLSTSSLEQQPLLLVQATRVRPPLTQATDKASSATESPSQRKGSSHLSNFHRPSSATPRPSAHEMAPNSLKTVGELASQLSQEFGDRDSQILRLEVENARLRALLEAATSHNPDFTTTNATPNVQPQSREFTAETRQQSEDALMDEACDVTGVDGDRSHRLPEVASGRSSITRRTECSFHYQNPSSDDDEDPIPRPKKEKAPLTAAAKDAPARTSHLGATVAAESSKRKRAPSTFVNPTSQASQENETRPTKRSRPPLAASSGLKKIPTTNKQTPTKKRTHLPHDYTPLQKSPFQRSSNATAPPPPREKQQSSNFEYPCSSYSSEGVSKNTNTARPSQPKWSKQKN